MDVPVLEPMARFNTIGRAEKRNMERVYKYPLSGYLGGVNRAGYWVERLEEEWAAAFGVKYAVACNSATSGLLAACMALRIGPGDIVWTTAYSMSATAACAKVLGARIVFIDIETKRFSMNLNGKLPAGLLPKCVIVTNLFGHPAYLTSMRSWCDSNNIWMIEDNAQAPFAMEGNRYAGTIGHIGVGSFNVHKPLNAGEGGICVTSSVDLAEKLRAAINHGELAGYPPSLNLRMSEPTAAISCAQLAKASNIIEGRREIALALTDMVKGIDFIVPPQEGSDCRHVYYCWAALVKLEHREKFTHLMEEAHMPLRAGYVTPLNKLFNSDQVCPITEMVEREIVIFEVCAWDVKKQHLRKMREIIHWAADKINENS